MKEVIRFTASWCGPCRMYKPIYEDVKSEYDNKGYKFIDVDIDNDTTGLAAKFKVRSVPSTVVIDENGNYEVKVGTLNTSELTKFIKG